MCRLLIPMLLSTAAFAQPATAPQTRWPPVRPAQVERMMREAVAYLYAQQGKAGHWEGTLQRGGSHYGGQTALVCYSLLVAGQSPRDPRIKAAVDFLRAAPMDSVYAVSLRLMVWHQLPWNTVQHEAREDLRFLLRGLIGPRAPAAGLYDYTDRPDGKRFDHSVSQFGVLGVWAAAQMGMDPGEHYWRAVERAWLRDQEKDGGWTYTTPGSAPSAGGVTAAGVASLFITQDYLRNAAAVGCNGNVTNDGIERGLAWLEANFRADQNPGAVTYWTGPHYWLYSVERVGVAGGRKYFGPHNWSDEGVRALARNRKPDGSFALQGVGFSTDIPPTAFALLFLARGNRPVVINKLQYDGPWNQRPRDVANLTRWLSERLETELHWQIVGIDNDVREFHDAPVLYVAGSKALAFTDEQKSRLRQYIEEGGLLLGHADCASAEFAKSFTELVAELVGGPMRKLPNDHLIHRVQPLAKPLDLWGATNGVRELCVLMGEGDAARAWQLGKPRESPHLFEAAANLIYYASDRGLLQRKGETVQPIVDPSIRAAQTARLARIEHEGNWNPEPGGWRRMRAILHNEDRLDVDIRPIKLGEGGLGGFAFAHLTGTRAPVLKPEQLRELRLLLARGGTLIVDAAGGAPEFAQGIEPALVGLIAGAKFEPIGAEDPIFASTDPLPEPAADLFPNERPSTTRAAEEDVLPVEYRRFARLRQGAMRELRLKGLRLRGRWVVVFSPDDLSAGLTGRNVDGLTGYSPRTATEIVRRIIVNGVRGGK